MIEPRFVRRDTGCWGRETELDELESYVTNKTRSATLLYGDSGIGKTTLLEALKSRLKDLPGVFVGFHETANADPDPLLRCLDNLLTSIYTAQTLDEQRKILWTNALDKASLTTLRQFLEKIVEVIGKFKGFEWLATVVGEGSKAARSLEPKVGAAPQVGIDEFRSILKLLQAALPDRKFVLIIDNLNAAAGSFGRELSGLLSLSTINSYLSLEFRKWSNVHLFASWQRDDKNAELLGCLIDYFREYGGNPFYLKSLQDAEGLRCWLGSLFPWFGLCDSTQQEFVLNLAAGLPEVVVTWRDNAVNSYNVDELTSLADDIRGRRYSSIKAHLEASLKLERQVLLALAFLGIPQPVRLITEIVNGGFEDVSRILVEWSNVNLLLKSSKAKSGTEYSFDHEIKRQIVLEERESLLERPEALCQQVYDYLLKTAGERRHTLDQTISTCLQLVSQSWMTIPRMDHRFLEQLWEMWKTEKAPERSDVNSWSFQTDFPVELQGQYLALSLHCRFGDRETILAALDLWADSLTVSGFHVEAATLLCRSLTHIAQHIEDAEFALYLKIASKVQSIHGNHPLHLEITDMYARTIASGVRICQNDSMIEAWESDLDRLSKAFPEEIAIADSYALYYCYATKFYAFARHESEKAQACIRELIHICSRYPESQRLAEITARAISLFMGSATTRPENGLWLVDVAREMRKKFPNSVMIASSLACTLQYSVLYVHEDIKLLLRYAADVRAMIPQFADETAVVKEIKEVVGTLGTLKIARAMIRDDRYGEGQDHIDTEGRLDAALKELLALLYPEATY